MAKIVVLWKVIAIFLSIVAIAFLTWAIVRAIYTTKKNQKIEAENAMLFKLGIERELAEKRNHEKVIQELDSQQATENAMNMSQTKIESTSKIEETNSNNNIQEEVTEDTIAEDFTPKKLSDFFVP